MLRTPVHRLERILTGWTWRFSAGPRWNGPGARHVFSIARKLGVPTDYLLDEGAAYPYEPPERRQPEGEATSKTRMVVTREEKAFLEGLRTSQRGAQNLAYDLPYVSMETLAVVHFLVFHRFDAEG